MAAERWATPGFFARLLQGRRPRPSRSACLRLPSGETAVPPAPSLPERIQTALRHAELNVQWYGEFHGLRQLRKVLYRYFPANPELHPVLKQVSTLKDLKQALLSAGCPVVPVPPNGPGYPECGR